MKDFDPNAWINSQKGKEDTTNTSEQEGITNGTCELPDSMSNEEDANTAGVNEDIEFIKINNGNVNEYISSVKSLSEVDLSTITDIDCSGLQALLALHKAEIKLVNPSDEIIQKLSTVGAGHII